ncbi:MAG: BamA/TamA family outer membrane protein [Rhodothermales bacterium]|nr:BamA/TamA family outer membrane protein [Rhodothermales bacterium]
MAAALLLGALALGLGACASSSRYVADEFRDWQAQPAPDPAQRAYRAFLLGDLGDTGGGEAVLDALRPRLQEAGEASALVFLGDQVPAGGLPDSATARRAEAEARLQQIVALADGYDGRLVVVPGHTDWNGIDALSREEAYLESALGRDVVVPDDGLPGPLDIELTDGLHLVALDTEWWLREAPTSGEVDDYEIETQLDFLLALDDLIQRRDDERLLVVGHHPVLSNGEHGGHFTLGEHLFPLRELWSGAYVPLPIVGSLYPLFRATIGTSQDLAGAEYTELREAMMTLFEEHPGIVYAAGHDHALQYFYRNPSKAGAKPQHFVVSGAAGDPTPVAPGYGAGYAHAAPGFAVVDFYEDGQLWLEFHEVLDGEATLAFRTQLEGAQSERLDPEVPTGPGAYPDYTDSTRVVVADPERAAGPLKRFFFGSGYRDVWTTPVEVPVLDLGRDFGGLTPVKRGGGFQTISLRTENPEGREYVLRQVKKNPQLALPPALRGTVAAEVFEDQQITANPYAAYAVPPMAEAAGIYHSNPQLRVVPDDPRLGRYRELFADQLVLVEERPDDDMSDVESFGRSEEVVSFSKLMRELRDDNDHRVDQPFYLRNRLFDVFLGDWDRHRDQWRWASFEPYELDPTLEGDARTQGKVYRPIPRDRDQVFFYVTGALPRLAKLFVPKLTDFGKGYGNLAGLTANGLHLDRIFLSELTREDWQAIAEDLQSRLTDEVLREGLAQWPEAVYRQEGERTFEILKARRDKLPQVADKFYRLLNRVVDVHGSDKHERFVINRIDDDHTEVAVYKTTKEGEQRRELYRRTFDHAVTEEVRLYAHGGRDRFEVNGEVGRGLFVRIIGGAGEDELADRSRVRGGGDRLHYYDTAGGNAVEAGPDTRVTLSDDPRVNLWEYEGYQHPYWQAVPFFGYNRTDGVFLGGGVRWVKTGFRKAPYARAHTLAANVSTRTGAVNAYWHGHWVGAFKGLGGGRYDAIAEAEVLSPQNVRNFFGFGNETEDVEDLTDFYEVQLARVGLAAGIQTELLRGVQLTLAPKAHLTRIDEDEDRITSDPDFLGPGFNEEVFDDAVFVGADAELDLGRTDRGVNPRQGFRWTNAADFNAGVSNTEDLYSRVESAFALYTSLRLDPQITLALRIGGAHVFGDFPFYDAATLGGSENLRGYLSHRFTGRSAFYQNAELRLKLLTLNTYAAPGELGLLGFVDNGRVWFDDEDSSTWHQGYGGGLWFSVFDALLLSGTVGASEEGAYVTVGLGFLY